MLFSGTLRKNLDPFDAYDNAELWRVLKLTSMENFVLTLNDGLEHKIAECGENLR